ncbi:MAG: T9SS type A sorting domain-containing protein [Flavobacteriales bacterium]
MKIKNIKVYDLRCRTVKTRAKYQKTNKIKLDISNQPEGVYIVKVEPKERTRITGKIIK